jgi:hypothetical protein
MVVCSDRVHRLVLVMLDWPSIARARFTREALRTPCASSGLFNGLIYFMYKYHWLGIGRARSSPDRRGCRDQFFTGWVIEYR